MFEGFVVAFVAFFVIIDPPGTTSIMVGLTPGWSAKERRRTAMIACLISFVVLGLFAIVGDTILRVLGITLPAFRIAGGLLLFLIALEMLFAKRRPRRTKTAEDIDAQHPENDITVFPLAIPLIAGPGAIANTLLLASQSGAGWQPVIVVLAAIGSVLILLAAMLSAAHWVERLVGETITDVITRILGLLLASLAVQFVIDGLVAALPVLSS